MKFDTTVHFTSQNIFALSELLRPLSLLAAGHGMMPRPRVVSPHWPGWHWLYSVHGTSAPAAWDHLQLPGCAWLGSWVIKISF